MSKMVVYADDVIHQFESEYAEPGLMGAPPNTTVAAERHLLRAIRHVVIGDMLARVQ